MNDFAMAFYAAFRLIGGFDSELRGIVILSLSVESHRQRLRLRDRRTTGYGACHLSFSRPRGGNRARQRAPWPAPCRRRPGGIFVAVAIGSVGLVRHTVHACRNGHCAVCARYADRDCSGASACDRELARLRRRPFGRWRVTGARNMAADEHRPRWMETSKGDLSLALALGIILIVLSTAVSATSLYFGRAFIER